MPSIWTDQRVEQLKELWVSGFSAGLIAKQMQLSKGAVIGKVNRLKLLEGDQSYQHQRAQDGDVAAKTLPDARIFREPRPKAPRKKKTAAAPKKEPDEIAAERVFDAAQRVTLLELGSFDCRDIVAYDEAHNPIFCGRKRMRLPTGKLSPWCDRHHALYCRPNLPREKKSAWR